MATDEETRVLARMLSNRGGFSTSTTLGQLAEITLFVLAERFEEVPKKIISFHTLGLPQQRYVPCFSSYHHAQAVANQGLQCLELSFTEIVDALPDTASLVLNPGGSSCFAISADTLTQLRECLATTSKAMQSSTEPPQRLEAFEENLKEELLAICAQTPQIKEAYFLFRIEQEGCSAILGLLCADLNAERRYELIESIASISCRYFAAPSAIEVFDDLELRTSRSWDLFKMLSPLYCDSEVERIDTSHRKVQLRHISKHLPEQ